MDRQTVLDKLHDPLIRLRVEETKDAYNAVIDAITLLHRESLIAELMYLRRLRNPDGTHKIDRLIIDDRIKELSGE